MIGQLLDFVRTQVDGAEVSEATVDPGGGANLTAQHFGPPGDDGRPLPDDFVALADSPGTGNVHATGYLDPKNAGEAEAGEKRIYARDSAGDVTAVVWLKGDGEVLIESKTGGGIVRVAPDGTVHVGALSGAAKLARDDRVEAELDKIRLALNSASAPSGGGAVTYGTPYTSVGAVGADKVRGT